MIKLMPTILIADDELSIRTILSKALKGKGFDVIKAEEGVQALGFLKSQPIDVAIIDIRMPGKTGLEILNAKGDFPSQPAIFIMTAQDTMENAIEAMKRGAFDYITKP
ncbi:MAG TPA: two-component system response regulator, partial [Deltaproteobacteria bacterium]|nr:two-component system response regulator [Deltaproteobacteria bacterium]